ncbi:hypothetical protein HDV01_003116 [Terramyces sp. JEL0728]|nr:hypothetical protein HDV01_003116 [Terramyces sp. JEL0728]
MTNTQLEQIDLAVQLFGSYSLFSVYVSLHILFTIFIQFQNSVLKKFVFAAFTILNFSTMYYFAAADVYSLATGNYDDTYFKLVYLQYDTQVFWKNTYVVMEVLPAIVILVKMIFGSNNKKLQRVMAKVLFIVCLALFQILIVIAFEVLNLIRTYTLWLGNDRVQLACSSINYLMQTVNSLIVLIVYEKLVDLLASMSNRKIQHLKKAPSASGTKL